MSLKINNCAAKFKLILLNLAFKKSVYKLTIGMPYKNRRKIVISPRFKKK